jgi:GST-like protein
VIDLYFSGTPNGLKLKLFFEETGIPVRIVPIRLSKGEHHTEEFRRISPNERMPAMVDHAPVDGGPPLAMFESGAMLQYLAEKYGVLLSAEVRARAETMQWLFWQMAFLGPMSGQAGHFRSHAPEVVPYAIQRYTGEIERQYGVLDRQLVDRDFIAGEYSIADIACYPWLVPHRNLGQDIGQFPNLQRWFERIAARPATVRSYEGVDEMYPPRQALDEETRRALFGPAGR